MEDFNISYVTRHSTIRFAQGEAEIESPFNDFPTKFSCSSPSDALFTYIDKLETHVDNVGRPLETSGNSIHSWHENDGWHIFRTRYGQIRTTNRGQSLGIAKIAIWFKGPGLLHSKEEHISDLNLAKKRALRLYIHSLEERALESQASSSIFRRWSFKRVD